MQTIQLHYCYSTIEFLKIKSVLFIENDYLYFCGHGAFDESARGICFFISVTSTSL